MAPPRGPGVGSGWFFSTRGENLSLGFPLPASQPQQSLRAPKKGRNLLWEKRGIWGSGGEQELRDQQTRLKRTRSSLPSAIQAKPARQKHGKGSWCQNEWHPAGSPKKQPRKRGRKEQILKTRFEQPTGRLQQRQPSLEATKWVQG